MCQHRQLTTMHVQKQNNTSKHKCKILTNKNHCYYHKCHFKATTLLITLHYAKD